MPIQPNASPDEYDSPYFKANEELCKRWESYILERKGKIIGNYNAWSFSLKSKVRTNREWLIDIKKATYSNGFLLLSTKYQNLQEILTFTTRIKGTGCADFFIEKSVFKGKSRDHELYRQVVDLLQDAIDDKSLYQVHFKKDLLTIIFHHKNDWFEMADRLLSFELKE